MLEQRGRNRTVIIGLDGIPFCAIEKLANKGVMPNTKLLIDNGTFRKMASSIPEISSVAWSSIITGKNPGEHGIYGFTDVEAGSYSMHFPNFNDLKSDAFWLKDEGMSVIINVPSTYPVKALNGVHISGFVSVDFKKSVYPQNLIPELKNLGYRIDVNAQKAYENIDQFLKDLDKTLDARIKVYQYLWSKYDWSNFMLVFTGTDRLSHFLWDALDNEKHKHHQEFINHFRKIDKAVGDIASKTSDSDILIMLSDHGFEELNENVNINYLLKDRGFLSFKKGSKEDISNISADTKAFALDPARIYLNLKGSYPAGSVKDNERDKIIEELTAIFSSLEQNGKKVVRDVYRKEDIYSGPYTNKAPDLVLVGNRGFNLKAKIDASSLYEQNIFKGKHSQEDAFFLVNRKCEDKIPSDFSVYKVLDVIDSVKSSTL